MSLAAIERKIAELTVEMAKAAEAEDFERAAALRNEIEARDPSRLEEATQRSADALAQRFGSGAIEGRIRAHVIDAVC